MSKEKKGKGAIGRALSSFGRTFVRLFVPIRDKNLSVLEEEALQTPGRTVLKNFFRNYLGVIGIVGFILVFLFSFVGSMIVPDMGVYTELTVASIRPGVNYLNYPRALRGRGDEIVKIVSGSSWSVALLEDGSLYMWGTESNTLQRNVSDLIMDIPEKVQNAHIVDIAAGTSHIIAIDDQGNFYGWGYYGNDQTKLPEDMSFSRKITSGQVKVKQLLATGQWSAIVGDDGNLYLWGSTQVEISMVVPLNAQGRIVQAAAGDNNMALLLDDGTVAVMGERGTEYYLGIPKELTDGSVRVVDIASTNRNAVAVDDQGNLYFWGSAQYGLDKIPEYSGKVLDVTGTYKNFTLVLEDGSVLVWGADELGQLEMPKNMGNVTHVFGDYSKFYAINDEGEIHAWGNRGYIFGTDQFGRDILGRLIHGGRISLTVGAIAVAIEVVIALLIGMVAGFFGKWVDMLLMRFTDIILCIPFMPIAMTLSAIIGNSISQMNRMYLIMVILGILGWPSMARLVRAQILLEREKDFVLAARALGIKQNKIITRHIMPNIFNLVIVNITLGYAGSLLSEAALSFLGFGVAEPTPSWGNMLQTAQKTTVIAEYWWRWLIPALFVVLSALFANLIGDALREAMDPKSNER